MANHFLRQLFFLAHHLMSRQKILTKSSRDLGLLQLPPRASETCNMLREQQQKIWSFGGHQHQPLRPGHYLIFSSSSSSPANAKVCCSLCHSLSIFMHRVQCHQHRRRHFGHPVSAITLAIGHCNRNSKLFIANRPNVRFCGNKKKTSREAF